MEEECGGFANEGISVVEGGMVGDGAGGTVAVGLGVGEACTDSADFRSHPASTSPTTAIRTIRRVFILIINTGALPNPDIREKKLRCINVMQRHFRSIYSGKPSSLSDSGVLLPKKVTEKQHNVR